MKAEQTKAEQRERETTKAERTRSFCLCGCGEEVRAGSRFRMGHDMRMFRIAREALARERDLTDEQREYLEASGKMQKVRERLEAEERKRRGRAERKATKSDTAVVLSELGDSEEEEA
jgi:uncharacterized protein with von Willebrand factor type A (vWA) domain